MRFLSADQQLTLQAVSAVFPFRVNQYVLDELIDWSRIPEDPIFQLTFPQEGMLAEHELDRMRDLIGREAPESEIRQAAREIQAHLNPHPSGQRELNVPRLEGEPVPGIQHKYRETVLYFPAAGQTCHAYCTYCFRWAQFIGDQELKFASHDVQGLIAYLRRHPEVSDVLITGGDPLIMKTAVLERILRPLLEARLEGLQTIRLGTKSLAYWPHRFVTDPDADELLALFERVGRSGVHLAFMAHTSHPREFQTAVAQEAIRRVLDTGAVIRCQAPVIRHVNDDPRVWAEMWSDQVALGAIPYYMFVERDTGPKAYFGLPLVRALEIYQSAFQRLSGLARTARGPVMSATPGKVLVDGTARVGGEDVFVLRLLQGRDPRWIERTFFARLDRSATWLDDLTPTGGDETFFFEDGVATNGSVGKIRALPSLGH